MRLLFLLIALSFPLLATAEVYKWTDPNGVVHYSDTPRQGATAVQLPPDQSISLPPINTNTPANTASSTPDTTPHSYTSIVITQPTDNATFVNSEQGNVLVSVDLKPVLQAGDQLQVVLDGRPVGSPQASTALGLNNVDRGEHTLQVQVLDSKLNVIGTSNTVTINMQRPRFMPPATGTVDVPANTPDNQQTITTAPMMPQAPMMPKMPTMSQ